MSQYLSKEETEKLLSSDEDVNTLSDDIKLGLWLEVINFQKREGYSSKDMASTLGISESMFSKIKKNPRGCSIEYFIDLVQKINTESGNRKLGIMSLAIGI